MIRPVPPVRSPSPVAVGTPSFVASRRDLAVLPLGLAVFWLVYSGPPVERLGPLDLRWGLEGPLSSTPWKWLGAFALVALVLLVERRRLSSLLILRPGAKDLEWALYAFGAAMTWSWLAGMAFPQDDATGGTGTLVALGVPGVLLLIATAAITEEVAFRGYLAERLGAVLRSRWWGAGLSLAVFVVQHVAFFGPSWLLHHLGGTLAIAVVVLVRRNLVAGMLVHLLVNAPILIPTVLAST